MIRCDLLIKNWQHDNRGSGPSVDVCCVCVVVVGSTHCLSSLYFAKLLLSADENTNPSLILSRKVFVVCLMKKYHCKCETNHPRIILDGKRKGREPIRIVVFSALIVSF